VQTKEPQDLRSGAAQEVVLRQRNHKTLEEGVRKKKNHKELRNKDKWRLF